MNAETFGKLLESLDACAEAREWAKGKSLKTAWETCERGDWMLWLCGRMCNKPGWPTRKELVLAACACAETALKYVPDGEDRPRIAIETVRKWARGEATLYEVKVAAKVAYDAAEHDFIYYAAKAAAFAAYSVYCDTDYYAAVAAIYAAHAASYAANAVNAAIVRAMLSVPMEAK